MAVFPAVGVFYFSCLERDEMSRAKTWGGRNEESEKFGGEWSSGDRQGQV